MGSPLTGGLLPLVLLLGAVAASKPKFRMSQKPSTMALGSTVELSCELLLLDAAPGCSWAFQPLGAPVPPRFLLYISRTRRPEESPGRLRGWRDSQNVYRLTLSRFTPEDQGHYFCLVVANSVVHFSPFVLLSLPAAPTTAPAPPRTPTRGPTTAAPPRAPRPDVCRPAAGGAVDTRRLDFACDLYIWAPLAGTCAALLLSLVVTVVCHRRNRRRVCKCPRPIVRPGGKPSPSERYS